MSRITTECEVYVAERDGKECIVGEPKLAVRSHWNRRDLVVIEIDGKVFAVTGDDLAGAIEKVLR